MSDEALLQTFTSIPELLPQAVFFLIGKRREALRYFYVVREHLWLWHSHDCSRDGQAHGIAQERVHIGLPCPFPDEELLASYFHGDDAQILLVGCGKSEFFEASVAGGVEGHLDAIEVMALDRRGHDLPVGV